jgi:hypothetical protein
VEPGPIEQFSKYERNLGGYDTGAIILNNDPEDFSGDLLDPDVDIRQDLCLLTGIEGVIDGFLDGGNDSAGRRVKPEQVLVLLEKLCDTDTPLLPGQFISKRQKPSPLPPPHREPALSGNHSAGP